MLGSSGRSPATVTGSRAPSTIAAPAARYSASVSPTPRHIQSRVSAGRRVAAATRATLAVGTRWLEERIAGIRTADRSRSRRR